MGYAAGQPLLWPCPPEWSNPVSETLAWLTDALQAKTGGTQTRALRAAPRRSFSFAGVVGDTTRRVVDAIRFDAGVQQVALPIYPDAQWLDANLAAGATSVPCNTAGFDFVAGGQAVLWLDATRWEVVAIDSIAADALALTVGTADTWPIGTRLYPLRTARVGSASKATHHSADVSSVDAALLIDEPCDWPAAWPTTTTYRGVPVLEWRNEESEDPVDQYDRLSEAVDQDTGPVFYFDLARAPFRAQSQRFVIAGRDQHTAFRSLLYALNGRAAQLWVPSWQADLQLAQPVTSGAKQLTVPWAGYTRFGRMQANRRDLAIELYDGTLLYRRITGSAESGDNETLQIDSALGVAVDPSAVRQIGWLSMCAQATDTVTLQHNTDADGVAIATLNWQAVKSDV